MGYKNQVHVSAAALQIEHVSSFRKFQINTVEFYMCHRWISLQIFFKK